jgi:hypothetical protein
VERLATDAGGLERAAFIKALSRETGRHP